MRKGKRTSYKNYMEFVNYHITFVNSLQDLQALKKFICLEIKGLTDKKKLTGTKDNKDAKKFSALNHWINRLMPLFISQALEEQENIVNPPLTDIAKYRYKARFKLKPSDLPNIKGYNLLVKYGFYNKDTNPNGVVKDHRYSIKDGFDNSIAPEILGQLDNCEFLLYKDNLLKSSKSSIKVSRLSIAPDF